MSGAAGVMALVLGQTVAGGLVLLMCTPLWGEVKHGFFKVTGIVLGVFAAATWASVAAGADAGSDAGRWALMLAAAATLLLVAMVVAMFARLDVLGRILGFIATAVSVAMLATMAATADASYALALFQLAAGAAFLGAVLDGLLLGHWYLTDRGLSRAPINRFAVVLIVAVVLEAVAIALGGFSPTEAGRTFNPILTATGLASYIALGMVAVTGLIAFVIRAALKGERASAVQSATGFFYLAVVTAFAGELAMKVRFLPGA